MHPFRSVLSLVFVAAVLGACSGLGDVPSGRRIGVFRLTHTPDGDHVSTTAFGEFYQDQGASALLPNSKIVTDTCNNPVDFSDLPTPPAVLAFLSPGDSVLVTSSASPLWKDYLKPQVDTVTAGLVFTYNLATGDTIPYAAHSLISFTVPGAASGMSPGTLPLLLAEPIAFTGTIDTATADSLHVTWNSAGVGDSSAVDVALIYDLNAGHPLQVFCVFKDDGDQWVNRNVLFGWRASNSHKVRLTRYRTLFQATTNQLLFGLSEYRVEKTTFP